MGGSGVEGMDEDWAGDAHMENGGERGAHTTEGEAHTTEGGGEAADAQSNLDTRVGVVSRVPDQVAGSVLGGLASAGGHLSTPPRSMAAEEARAAVPAGGATRGSTGGRQARPAWPSAWGACRPSWWQDDLSYDVARDD